ncbi:hypothetical protein DMUE_1455 [Dictyocoela muelleri]|nr:hypothetical protein DMUE_1455 [Dictyocoela muelleri]
MNFCINKKYIIFGILIGVITPLSLGFIYYKTKNKDIKKSGFVESQNVANNNISNNLIEEEKEIKSKNHDYICNEAKIGCQKKELYDNKINFEKLQIIEVDDKSISKDVNEKLAIIEVNGQEECIEVEKEVLKEENVNNSSAKVITTSLKTEIVKNAEILEKNDEKNEGKNNRDVAIDNSLSKVENEYKSKIDVKKSFAEIEENEIYLTKTEKEREDLELDSIKVNHCEPLTKVNEEEREDLELDSIKVNHCEPLTKVNEKVSLTNDKDKHISTENESKIQQKKQFGNDTFLKKPKIYNISPKNNFKNNEYSIKSKCSTDSISNSPISNNLAIGNNLKEVVPLLLSPPKHSAKKYSSPIYQKNGDTRSALPLKQHKTSNYPYLQNKNIDKERLLLLQSNLNQRLSLRDKPKRSEKYEERSKNDNSKRNKNLLMKTINESVDSETESFNEKSNRPRKYDAISKNKKYGKNKRPTLETIYEVIEPETKSNENDMKNKEYYERTEKKI